MASNVFMSFPDQSPEETELTKQFALEVVDLLKHNPRCRMPFNKFIPAYHHHFGHQCRVADYGFSKLIELFEALPHVVEVRHEMCVDAETVLIPPCPASIRPSLTFDFEM